MVLPLGYRKGWLIVDEEERTKDKKNRWGYICFCSACGKWKWLSENALKFGRDVSCGCMRKELLRQSGQKVQATKHEKEFVAKYTRR